MDEKFYTYEGMMKLESDELQNEFAESPAESEDISPLADSDITEIIDAIQAGRSLSDDLADPDLFLEHKSGDYTYNESILGKSASGSLELRENPERDAKAQRIAGGEDRRIDDDGGHLIGARFGGAPGEENLDAQNRQLNRGDYKAVESELAKELKDGDKVFLDVDTLKADGTDRPYAYMGYAITEHPDGTRESKSFTFPNESREVQVHWGEEPRESPSEQDYIDAINEMNYTDFPEIDLEDGMSKVDADTDDDIGSCDENDVKLNVNLDSDVSPDFDIVSDQDANIDYDVGVDTDGNADFDISTDTDSRADLDNGAEVCEDTEIGE